MKAAVWIVAAVLLAGSPGFDTAMLLPLLLCIAADVADARYLRSIPSALAKTAVILVLAWYYPSIAVLVASAAFDLALVAPVASIAVPVAAVAAVVPGDRTVLIMLATVLGAVAGWIARQHDASRVRHIAATDAERAARYRLEEAQRRLETTSAALVRATERAERTRIAHAIHDDVGHRLTGVLMQLQAARRLVDAQPDRASAMVDTAIAALTAAVESVRETVHDLRPRPESDAAALRRFAAEFRFCPVDVSLDDRAFTALPVAYREVCLAAVRELLTNAARHSGARSITVTIDVGARVRLVYRDDGIGAGRIREGLGLRGIRHRVEALGGTAAVSGHDGFAVRCMMPLEDVGTLEGANG